MFVLPIAQLTDLATAHMLLLRHVASVASGPLC